MSLLMKMGIFTHTQKRKNPTSNFHVVLIDICDAVGHENERLPKIRRDKRVKSVILITLKACTLEHRTNCFHLHRANRPSVWLKISIWDYRDFVLSSSYHFELGNHLSKLTTISTDCKSHFFQVGRLQSIVLIVKMKAL